jgi:lipopolysaccharide transport system ATP-binding protein
MKPIIKVEGISKQFRINPGEAPSRRYETLRETLVKIVRSPFARKRRSRRGDDIIWALKDVNFEVIPGEVMGIIGPNGAGKSTLLKVLSRIIEPTSGRVELYGRVASLLEVGTGFHPDLSGRENVYLNGAILGMKRREIDTRFDEIVAFSEVEKFIDTAVKHYSSGMYLRLAFAVAAHLDPEVLIVDEVLAVGDASFQKKCLGKMDDVTRSGRTVLLVTHSLGMVTQHCQRALLLNGGRIIRSGGAQDVVDHYDAMCELAQIQAAELRTVLGDNFNAANRPGDH